MLAGRRAILLTHWRARADERWRNFAEYGNFAACLSECWCRMPEIDSSIHLESTATPRAQPVRETRFDAAHEIARGEFEFGNDTSPVDSATPISSDSRLQESVSALLSETYASEDDNSSLEAMLQFRLQAQQLAAYLEQRQRDLDRCQAELHARMAQQETTARNARLWFQERNNEFEERQSQLEAREEQVRSKLVELDQRLEAEATSLAVSTDLQQQHFDTLSTQQDEIVLRELELQRREAELEESVLELKQREQHCQQYEHKLAQRQQAMEEAEAVLAREQVEFNDARQAAQQREAEHLMQVDHQQTKTIEQQRLAEVELEKQREALANRAKVLERRATALDQMRADLLRIQREALETRLATEELWSQMSGLVPPASITQSLARLRVQLAENFRLQATDIVKQKTEAEELAAKVAREHGRLASQKNQWQKWAASERQQIELHAARLVAREEELQREQSRYQQAQQQWQSDRQTLEREIRRLQSQVKRSENGAPATF
jgi:hypothetical protein